MGVFSNCTMLKFSININLNFWHRKKTFFNKEDMERETRKINYSFQLLLFGIVFNMKYHVIKKVNVWNIKKQRSEEIKNWKNLSLFYFLKNNIGKPVKQSINVWPKVDIMRQVSEQKWHHPRHKRNVPDHLHRDMGVLWISPQWILLAQKHPVRETWLDLQMSVLRHECTALADDFPSLGKERLHDLSQF